jgi:sterol desaturase/sphingolipid hydroxylase (fatty acid hydroxylase superfamily)
VHPLDQIVTKSLTLVPLYLMGFSKATFGAYVGLATLHAVFIHANVKFKFGKLRWWLGTPEFHHWHHSNEPQAFNRNFAGELPLLDWIFGTIYLPDRLPTAYGTNEPVPTGYVGQMLFPFRRPSTS